MIEVVTEREHKVAIATRDGKRIAHHFRTAPFFTVYTIRKGKLVSAETRINAHAALPAAKEGGAECWKVIDEALSDVRVVICSGMGENAYVGLLKKDILPLLTDEEHADRALDAYLHGHLKEHPELVHEATHHAKEGSSMRSPLKRGKEGGKQ